VTTLWGTAVWGVDRWPAISIAEALQQAPDPTHGVPSGVGDWRFCVEVLLPSDQLAIWGIATWGDVEWPQYRWFDITPWCRGAEWTRGADEPYGRPRIGTATLTLDSRYDEFSPWSTPSNILYTESNEILLTEEGDPIVTVGRESPGFTSPTWWSPGTVVRVGLRSPSDSRARGWLPQFCGLVDSWRTEYATANAADIFATVTLVETLRDLSQIDENALPGVVGGGEGALPRIERLLEAADWKYGLLVEAQNLTPSSSYPVQSTDMANNRITECYRVADAADVHFRTDRTGAALLTNVEYIGNVGTTDRTLLPLSEFSRTGANDNPYLGFLRYQATGTSVKYVPYRPDSFRSATDDANVVNDVRIARVGGTQQTYEQTASISRYGRRTLVRNDFPNTGDTAIALIAQYISIRRGLNVLRVENATVDIDRCGTDHALATLAADIQSNVWVWPPSYTAGETNRYIRGYIRSMTHRVTPRNTGSVTWEASFAFDTRTVFNVPGAQLPSS
jgi:hypothetical protein